MRKFWYAVGIAGTMSAAACSTDTPTTPSADGPATGQDLSSLASQVRLLAVNRGITRLVRPAPRSPRTGSARPGSHLRQGVERQSRHLVHDLPSAPPWQLATVAACQWGKAARGLAP